MNTRIIAKDSYASYSWFAPSIRWGPQRLTPWAASPSPVCPLLLTGSGDGGTGRKSEVGGEKGGVSPPIPASLTAPALDPYSP